MNLNIQLLENNLIIDSESKPFRQKKRVKAERGHREQRDRPLKQEGAAGKGHLSEVMMGTQNPRRPTPAPPLHQPQKNLTAARKRREKSNAQEAGSNLQGVGEGLVYKRL